MKKEKNWVKNIKLFVNEVNKVKSPINIKLDFLVNTIPYVTLMYLLWTLSPVNPLNFTLLWSIMAFEILFRLVTRRDSK